LKSGPLRIAACFGHDQFRYNIRVQQSSVVYYTFVAAVFFLYWLSSQSRFLRLAAILLANYVFCAHFGLFYVLLLPLCSTLDFLIGLGLIHFRRPPIRRTLLSLSLFSNLAILILSRHVQTIVSGLGRVAFRWDWVFPLSLSFYALQSLTYTIDLYRRDGEGTSSLLAYLASASFFPTLQAGPITRLTDLVGQFSRRPILSRTDGGRAFFLIGLGLVKKVLIADYLAENLVKRVFDTPTLYSGAEVLIAVYAYSFQLYYDFSGYTDIARGTGMLLGIKLPRNFDRPYQSANVAEFWRRWHMSFSSWLRDYVYFSLPGARTKVMPYINLILTMLLAGLWHGVNGTFVVWGLLHGCALAITRLWWHWRRPPRERISSLRRGIAILCTYQFVCLTWVFFRAASVSDAWTILGRIGSLTGGVENISVVVTAVLLVALGALFVRRTWYSNVLESFARCPFFVHAAGLLLVAVAIQFLGGYANTPFVYSGF